MSAPHETQRLAALHALELLDTAPEERFDRITRLAARLFGVPVVYISLIDAERQWFKSRIGVPYLETPLTDAFCTYTVGQDEVLTVRDASLDPRFAALPSVAGEPGVRFYAGHPVSTGDGVHIGTLCIIDTVARDFDDEERVLLRDLACVVANEIAAGALKEAVARRRALEERRLAYFRTSAHELRTPMASILGFSELLLKREFDPATGRELLGIIHQQSTRMVALINQMLDLARIQDGGPEEDRRSSTSLASLAADAVAAAVPPARAADVTLTPGPGIAPVAANALRLHQALVNILANAVKFSNPGDAIGIAVDGATRDGRPGVAVEIRDHGMGMQPGQVARMFDAFYRGGDQPDREGAGLGLALVHAIVTAHGGAIEAQARPGAGTTVRLWLPAAQVPA